MRKAVFFHPRCKLWSCPVCGQINQDLWTWRAAAGAQELVAVAGQKLDFITLTSHEKLGAAASVNVWPKAWGKLYHRLQRAAPGTEYFMVPERHKTGRIHIHAIITAQLPKKWWKDVPRACGMGYQSDRQEVQQVGGVGAYVGKYLAKTLQFSNWKRGFRRVRTSQGWPKLPAPVAADGWIFSKLDDRQSLSDAILLLQQRGYIVGVMGHKSAWDFVDGQDLG